MNKIKKDPEKYLGSQSILGINAFQSGYYALLRTIGVEQSHDLAFWSDFIRHVETKYKLNRNALALIYVSGYTDSEAFSLYFRELEEYIKTCGVSWTEGIHEKQSPQQVELYPHLKAIRDRPLKFLMPANPTTLYAWVNGFQEAVSEYISGNSLIRPDLHNFERWLCQKQGLKHVCRWDRLILWMSDHDEAIALAKFFDEMDTFASNNT